MTRDAGLFQVEKCILCMLHADNHMTERVLGELFSIGFAPTEQNNKAMEYIARVEKLVNSKILASSDNYESNWSLSTSRDKYKNMESLSLANA